MTDEEQTPQPAPTDRMAKARAVKKEQQQGKKAAMVDATALILDLQRQISELREAAKAAVVPMTIPSAPEPSEENRPGSYVKVFEDKAGNAMYQKVHWNKSWIERSYDMVTFTPNESMKVLPHGVKYDLLGGVEVTVPTVVKKIYEDSIRGRENMTKAYRSWRPEETADVHARAVDNPGTRQWSRVARLGVGIVVGEEEGPKAS